MTDIAQNVQAAEHTLSLGTVQPNLRSSKAVRMFILGLVCLTIVLIVFREHWLMQIGDFLFIQDDLYPVDVIHVIAGEDYRTDYAIQLYDEGFGKTLYFTGGWCETHLYNHGQHAQGRSLAAGVPLDAIAIDDATVTSTYMEAERLKEWIDHNPNPIRSVIVVSDPFHMRRARWIFQRVLGDEVEVLMAPVPFDRTPYQHTWWKDPLSRQNVRDEYLKFVYNVIRYKYSWGFIKDWLISLDTE